MIRYAICAATTTSFAMATTTVQADVARCCAEGGWRPKGGISVAVAWDPDSGARTFYAAQAIVKEATDVPDPDDH